jgi:hypothetical protein
MMTYPTFYRDYRAEQMSPEFASGIASQFDRFLIDLAQLPSQ